MCIHRIQQLQSSRIWDQSIAQLGHVLDRNGLLTVLSPGNAEIEVIP
jgi:hypothetical protein